jgi:hypothetical protein
VKRIGVALAAIFYGSAQEYDGVDAS